MMAHSVINPILKTARNAKHVFNPEKFQRISETKTGTYLSLFPEELARESLYHVRLKGMLDCVDRHANVPEAD